MEDLTAVALAYQDAERRKAEAEEAARLKAEAVAREQEAERVYDPRPDPYAEPHELTLYEGTGIGALYGVGPQWALDEIAAAGWTVLP